MGLGGHSPLEKSESELSRGLLIKSLGGDKEVCEKSHGWLSKIGVVRACKEEEEGGERSKPSVGYSKGWVSEAQGQGLWYAASRAWGYLHQPAHL